MESAKAILIVDDEKDVLDWLEKKLTGENYRVIKARLAREALEKARKERPQLILMDIVLPDMEGSEVVRTLAEDPLTRDVSVIFMSGIISKEEQKRDMEVKVGGRMYRALGKPFDADELLREIRRCLG